MKDTKKIIKEYENFSKENGFRLNPNKKLVNFLIKALLENKRKYGKRYCPCRVITDDPKENNRSICPCEYMIEEIDTI